MSTRPRSASAIVLLAMLPWVAFVGLDADKREAKGCLRAMPKGFTTAKECGTCHPTIYKEWQESAHSRAWTNEVYQQKLKEKREATKSKREPTVCYDCHIPQSVLARLGRKPRRRKDQKTFHEGVTCVACHEHNGKIHGPFGSKTDAHPVEKNPVFTTKNVVTLCKSCHNTNIGPVLKVVKDFEGSGLAAKGESCIGCHMTEVERHIAVNALGNPIGQKRKGRSHRILGPRDPEFLASAFKLQSKRNGKDIDVIVENKAGHKVPALTLRRFVFHVRQLDKNGAELAKGKFELHHENLLKVTEKRHFPFPFKQGTHKVEIRAEHVFEGQVVAEFLKKVLNL